MSYMDGRLCLEEAFGRIEETILPSLSAVLATLLAEAEAGAPVADAELRAAELRAVAAELQALTLRIEAASSQDQPPADA